MRHIAILDEELPFPLNSGKRIRTFNLVRRLAGSFRVTYLCHANSDPEELRLAEEKFREIGVAPRVVPRAVPSKSGLSFYTRLFGNLFSNLPYSVATHASRELRLACEELLRDDPPDLWHCEWTPYAHTLRGLPVPWVVMAHNVESLIWQRYTEHERNPLKKWYLRRQWKKFDRFERWAYQKATLPIAVSPEDAELMRTRFQVAEVEVVENGVDTGFFVPNPDVTREPRTILFLGSLDWRPNLDGVALLLDEIFPQVRNYLPDARLLLVGRKPPEWLRERAKSEAGVELHADVQDVRPFLWRSSLLAVPLRIGGGSRLKILEALASGLPVVSTRVGAEGLNLQDGKHLVITEKFAAGLIQALQPPAELRRLAIAGRERVLEQYDWTALAGKLGRVWERASARGTRGSRLAPPPPRTPAVNPSYP
jgi:polysaccharide biosynthesis protein PslH